MKSISIGVLNLVAFSLCAASVRANGLESKSFDELYTTPIVATHGDALGGSDNGTPKDFNLNAQLIQGPTLVTMKEMLKGVPANSRETFINERIANSRKLVSAKSAREFPVGDFTDILAGVPENIKSRFLDSLTFKSDVIVSAFTGDLKASVSEAAHKQIMDSLAPAHGQQPINGLGLCGNGWCDDVACIGDRNRVFKCRDRKKETCWTSCDSYNR